MPLTLQYLTGEYWKHNHLSQRASNFQATTYLKLFPKHFCNVTLSTQLQPSCREGKQVAHPVMTLPLLCQLQTKSCLILWWKINYFQVGVFEKLIFLSWTYWTSQELKLWVSSYKLFFLVTELLKKWILILF
jgi:hypothetical protein